MEPRIQYAKTADGVNIAYTVTGEGPPLLRAAVPGMNHAQRDWTAWSRIFLPLAERFRLILYDARGTGLSDRGAVDFSMDAMLRDMDAVVGKVGLEIFALCTWTNGAPIAVSYAATRPERVSHLILLNGLVRLSDFSEPAAAQAVAVMLEKDWVLYTEFIARVIMGVDDPDYMRQMAEHMRACIDPGAAAAFYAQAETYDVHHLLPLVQAQTLVVQAVHSPLSPPEMAQRLAAEIPGAQYVDVDDPKFERTAVLIEDFVLGGADREAAVEPTLQGFRTILFTDIEGSTAMTQRLGDAKGREVLREHERITRDCLRAHGGSEVKTMGDGFMASFGSAVKALECAIVIQRAFAHRNEMAPEPILVRIGLNAGEPIAEDDDLFGASVNLAARIAAQAEGGEILASEAVRQIVAGKKFPFSDRGEAALRGFEDRVHIYQVSWRGAD